MSDKISSPKHKQGSDSDSQAPKRPKKAKLTETGSQPTVDEVLARLEGVVAALEAGDLPLETALAQFEEGVRLVRQGGELLDRIEQRVEVLLADRNEVVAFSAVADELGEDD